MMKMMMRILALLLAALLPMTLSLAETADAPVATVNGEVLTMTEYSQIASAIAYQYEAAGLDLSDETIYAYVMDQALTYAIEQMLILQDMRTQGCYDFTEEEEAWCLEQGKAAWETALHDVGEEMRDYLGLGEDEDVTEYALSYAESLGVTEATYVEEYRTQLALANYYDWLLRDTPITDEAVQAAYDERVAVGRALYEQDVPAFETAVTNGQEVWYKPAGYRSVLQILLPAEGKTEAERLASVQEQMDAIYTRLEQGEAFEILIAQYGADGAFADPDFYQVGYQVHRDSIIWEDAFIAAAFSAEMAAPGCWSQPFVSDLGVHILYYLADQPGGPVEMTEDVHDALAYVLYSDGSQAALQQRQEELAKEADVVIH